MNCLFKVIEKDSEQWDEFDQECCSKIIKVFDVKRNKNGFPHFLVYEDNQWKYKSAKLYEPIIGN